MDITKITLIALISFFSLLVIYTFINIIRNRIKEKENREKVIFPEKYAYILNQKNENDKKKKKKTFFIKKLYQEYVFFYDSAKAILISSLIGYVIFVLIFYLLCNDVLLATILALSYLVVEYIFIDGRITKARKKYVKDFSSAISVLSTSTEAGNTLEKGILAVTKRDTIGKKMKEEFGRINNDLKNNKPLDEALENFYKRNSMFQEVSMFVVIIQFFNKKGGDGLRDILDELSQSLNTKINNYSEIDAEVGLYKILMNFFIYGYFACILVVKMFMPTFYANILDQKTTGYLKVLVSMFLYILAIYYYKSMMRNSAEG